MKKDNSIRLYNIMFPIWFLFFFPLLWLVMLPVNFGVDSLVLMLSARKQQVEDRKQLWKKHLWSVWGIGFLNPVLFPGATITAIPGVILAGVLIYFLNKKLTFRKSTLDAAVIHKLCLHLAIFTVPYTMLIPLYF